MLLSFLGCSFKMKVMVVASKGETSITNAAIASLSEFCQLYA